MFCFNSSESDLLAKISPANIPGEVISAVYELVRNNQILKQHIGPMLNLDHDPKYDKYNLKKQKV